MIKVNICRDTLSSPILIILLVWGVFSLFAVDSMASVSYRNLIPEPVSVVEKEGAPFIVNGQTKVLYSGNHSEWKSVADLLAACLSESTGYSLSVGKTKKLLRSNEIIFKKNPLQRKEGFKLEVTEDNMVIEAADLAGAFYAVQMLRQLSLPTAVGEAAVQRKELSFPPVALEDYPSLSYRGAMLDVSRHFFSVAQVKRYIDLLAFHRLKHFHWHLTDDQG